MTRRHLYLLIVLWTLPSLAHSWESGEADNGGKGPMLVAPFTQEEAVSAQKECSERLGTPVELTNSIGMKLKLIPAGEFVMGSAKLPQELIRLFELDERWAAKWLTEEHV